MLRDAAVDLLMRRLGKRTYAPLKDVIISEMSFAQEEILEQSETLPWFLITEQATVSTVIGEERVVLPDDFLQEWDDGALYIIDTSGGRVELVRDDWDTIKHTYNTLAQDKPRFYDLVGENYLVRPIPNAVYALEMRYYAKGVSLAGVYGDVNNVENLWLKWAGALLIAHTGFLVASEYLQSDKLAAKFIAQIQGADARLMAMNTAMEETNKQRFMEG
jgi:hypothetical protein